MINREGAYAALRDRIESVLTAVPDGIAAGDGWSVTRIYRDFDDTGQAQPACIVVATSQRPIAAGPGNVHVWQLEANAIVYMRPRGSDAVVDTAINQVIDQIDGALNATPQEADSTGEFHTTLGGVVVRASIEGAIHIFQGLPEGQTVVVIPITMLVA